MQKSIIIKTLPSDEIVTKQINISDIIKIQNIGKDTVEITMKDKTTLKFKSCNTAVQISNHIISSNAKIIDLTKDLSKTWQGKS